MAEAHNAAGNDAFNSGDFPKAVTLYYKAVKADGKVAKYRTNLANALLKCGRVALALEEAAAAIAVDGTWPKGYYFKSLALEELGEYSRALAACEEGLHIHRHNEALDGIHGRLKKKLHKQQQQQRQQQEQEQRQQQQRQQQAAVAAAGTAGGSRTRTVTYRATVRDAAGHEKDFCYKHQIDASRLSRAAGDRAEATRILQEVTMPHHDEMLKAKPWVCVSCQLQHGKHQRATKLFMHAMSYLTKPEPLVQDMGPTPACSAQACATYSTQMAQQMMADLMRQM